MTIQTEQVTCVPLNRASLCFGHKLKTWNKHFIPVPALYYPILQVYFIISLLIYHLKFFLGQNLCYHCSILITHKPLIHTEYRMYVTGERINTEALYTIKNRLKRQQKFDLSFRMQKAASCFFRGTLVCSFELEKPFLHDNYGITFIEYSRMQLSIKEILIQEDIQGYCREGGPTVFSLQEHIDEPSRKPPVSTFLVSLEQSNQSLTTIHSSIQHHRTKQHGQVLIHLVDLMLSPGKCIDILS